MSSLRPTLRSIARELGISHTTVSDALRGAGRVDAGTVERVRKAASASGYEHNPLAASLMSEMRRSGGTRFQGLLATVDIHEPKRPLPGARFHRELLAGIGARALELGFKTEAFVVGRSNLTLQRLDSILQSRGIHGLILLPGWEDPDWSKLDWARYSGIYTDYRIERPALHCVCCDHHRSMMTLLEHLADLGYRRPGLFLQDHQDERIQRRFSTAFHGFQKHHPGIAPVPPLLVPELQRERFRTWFQKFRPDVVLSHYTETIGWMESCGAKLPGTHGFAILNTIYKTRPCAGLDLQPREIGARSVDLVVTQARRNERGLPAWPTTTTIPARWVDGPTVRRAPAPSA